MWHGNRALKAEDGNRLRMEQAVGRHQFRQRPRGMNEQGVLE